jgi:DNA processing protein
VDQQLERALRADARFVALGDDEYPPLLARIYDPPPFLWVRGHMTPADARAVAVVGTRRATDYGRRAAATFAAGLVEHGLTVVSGLAYGIDIAAHRAALDAGGRTIAVLGSGVDRVYPGAHAPVARRIVEEGLGAVVSEVPMGTDPARGAFPSRNRIVAGMALGTLVAESGPRGGALLTAAMALDQNREVFAVPAPVFSEMQGANRLVQRGYAALVMAPAEIVETLAPHLPLARPAEAAPAEPPPLPPDLTAVERRLMDALTADPQPLDALCDAARVDASSALVYLLQLEFRGLVRQLAGKQFFRVASPA